MFKKKEEKKRDETSSFHPLKITNYFVNTYKFFSELYEGNKPFYIYTFKVKYRKQYINIQS